MSEGTDEELQQDIRVLHRDRAQGKLSRAYVDDVLQQAADASEQAEWVEPTADGELQLKHDPASEANEGEQTG